MMRSLSTRAAGLLILILGVWGALVPFVGPYFHFTLGPTHSWTWTSGRLWLNVLPGIAAVIGGLMLLSAGPRATGKIGALLALAAGAWFAIGPDMSLLWNASGAQGAAHGSTGVRVLEMITYHTGLGVAIAALAGYALPGFITRRAAVTEAGAAAGTAAIAEREATARPRRREVAEPAPVGEAAPVRREPVAVGAPAGERATEYESASPVADRRGEYGNGDGPATAPATRPTTAESPATASAAPTTTADTPPAASASPTTASTPTEVRRRRRGGLLSVFGRR